MTDSQRSLCVLLSLELVGRCARSGSTFYYPYVRAAVYIMVPHGSLPLAKRCAKPRRHSLWHLLRPITRQLIMAWASSRVLSNDVQRCSVMCKVGRGAPMSDMALVPMRASDTSGTPRPRIPRVKPMLVADMVLNTVSVPCRICRVGRGRLDGSNSS